MTIDPQVLRAERHGEIGHIVQRDVSILIERWSYRAVHEQPNGRRVHHEALLDDLPDLLDSLGLSLAEPNYSETGPHCGPARAHGVQRWEDGWSLSEVVRDYQILRVVLFDHLEQALDRPLIAREVQAIGLALDEAINASVAAYARQRDEHTRSIEASLQERAIELREADRRKNEFLAVLAHELRNPLAPILSSVEVLRLMGPADTNVVRARDIVERQVKQMVRLVDDLLDMTRIAQGKIELRYTTFDIAFAIAEAIQTTTPLFQAQKHLLNVHLPNEPLLIKADQARIVQILVNLLNNAAKYTDPGGRVELTAAKEGNEAVVRIKDNGIGIESEMLGKVFELFTQVGRSTDRSQGGLGIGLTLVRQLVEIHKGEVTVHSDGPGRGSEFVVRLPAAASTETETFPQAVVKSEKRGLRILIVEDNADARTTLKMLLDLLGHHVEIAETGQAGIDLALTSPPQAVLIDLGLPGIDGCKVAQRLREKLGPSVLLVALTGHALEENRRQTQEAGFDAHLVKPVELEELVEVLEAHRHNKG